MLEMPVLETGRLIIRPFVLEDLSDVHRLLDIELHEGNAPGSPDSLAERTEWLQWSVLNYRQLARLDQPPYGDRAVILKATGGLIGACGFAPCLNVFEQLPGFASQEIIGNPSRYTSEIGLYYAISPAFQRQGFATEAAQALIDYAFQNLDLKRVVATTTYANEASQAVMRKLGMQIGKNPLSKPAWLQVVGLLENKSS